MRRLVLVLLFLSACQTSEPRVFPDNPRPAPDMVGTGIAEARAELESEGYVVDIELEGIPPEEQPDNAAAEKRCPTGVVKEQDPVAGTRVVKATTVTLVVTGCG